MARKNENYSAKFMDAAMKPRLRGAFFQEDAALKGFILVEVKQKELKLFLLVHPKETKIYDARFFTYGGTESTAIGEAVASLLVEKKIEEISAITPDMVERALRGDPEVPSVPDGRADSFEIVTDLMEAITKEYVDAHAVALAASVLKEKGEPSPVSYDSFTSQKKKWLALGKDEQLKKIENVLELEVRQFLNQDGGDVEVVDLVDGVNVMVEYQGACGSCAASTGSTLFSIESSLRSNLYDGLRVIPNGF
ncbi:hypothetical protein MNBD_NITROSPINAE02-810 [hydrothermal vent metagenome]|uniref:Nitrogen fixation protein NifU n=1 Tax=hydrothermal vent metagenome TaxID=652676 RepID=A0A3B1BUZ0_9ZZZZ